jgi:hypothetical protein
MTPGTMEGMAYRLTQYAHGGGSACKIRRASSRRWSAD